MARIDRLTLALTNVLPQLRALHEQGESLHDWPALSALLEAGTLNKQWSTDDPGYARLDAWQAALLQALGPNAYREGLASAALSWRGSGSIWRKGTYLLVEPVHLAAGIDRLQLLPSALDAQEWVQVLASARPLLSLGGFELQTSKSGQWYAWCEPQLDVITYSPRSPFASRVDEIMPGGSAGPKLRRLMTELQMLLHEHPVNLRRQARGAAPINALWLWGAGQLDLVSTPYAQKLFGDGDYVRGLCEHLQLSCAPAPQTVDSLLRDAAAQTVAVLHVVGERAALRDLDSNWLQPLAHATRRGQIKKLELCMDHWRLTVDGRRWRSWRRLLAGKRDYSELFA